MPTQSPYDMIRKASRHVTAPDRWAALSHNAQDRTPVSAQPPAAGASKPAQAEPAGTYAQPRNPAQGYQPPQSGYQAGQGQGHQPPQAQMYPQAQPPQAPAPSPPPQSAPASPSYPGLMQPPFPPPQARHPFLDEIGKRHEQAIKSARNLQTWDPNQKTEVKKQSIPDPPSAPKD